MSYLCPLNEPMPRRFNHPNLLRRFHHTSDGPCDPIPLRAFGFQAAASGSGQAIIFRTPVVLRHAPLGCEQPAQFEPMQRRIKRTFLYAQYILGTLMNQFRDAVAVQRLARPVEYRMPQSRQEDEA
jgi:hypothetical protein